MSPGVPGLGFEGGVLIHLEMVLRSLGCVWDPARFPQGLEVGLDLAPTPQVLDWTMCFGTRDGVG